MHADAVFLDVPAPWEAVGHARAALDPSVATRICTFSPCMEQVLRTTQALADAGFTDIETFESLTREHQPFTAALGPLTNPARVAARLRDIERVKQVKRLEQIERSRLKKHRSSTSAAAHTTAITSSATATTSTDPPPAEADADTSMQPDGAGVDAATTATATEGKRPSGSLEDAAEGAHTPARKRAKLDDGAVDGARAPGGSDPGTGVGTGSVADTQVADAGHYRIASGPKVSSGTTALQPANVLSKPATEVRPCPAAPCRAQQDVTTPL